MPLTEMTGLYLVTDAALCKQAGRSVEDTVAGAIKGGARIIQLRDKDMLDSDFIALALHIKDLTDANNAILIINDRVALAHQIGANGVHVGQSDMGPIETRKLLGPNVIIGFSVETQEQAKAALALPEGTIDCLGVSPVFATPTKTGFENPPWGLDGLRWLRSMTQLPLVAIGGIGIGNAREVIAAGADSIAVVSAICSAKEPQIAASELAALF